MMIKEELFVMTLPYYDGSKRTVRVFVPEHDENEKLPVIYMTDGQNLFDETPQMFGCWHTMEAVREESQNTGKAAIIVGIHNDGHPQQRTNELTPAGIGPIFFPPMVPKEIVDNMRAEGEKFDDFVVNTVIPAIEARFPVKTGRENTAFCGSSSGGLQSFFTALIHPDLFGCAGVFSPCFMIYYPNDLECWIRETVSDNPPYLYLYAGGAEGLEAQTQISLEMTDRILQDCYPSDLIKKVIKPEQPHHESAWEPIFKDFLHDFLS